MVSFPVHGSKKVSIQNVCKILVGAWLLVKVQCRTKLSDHFNGIKELFVVLSSFKNSFRYFLVIPLNPPSPLSDVENSFGCVGWSIFNIAWGKGG